MQSYMQITRPLQILMKAHRGPWHLVSLQICDCVGKCKYLRYNISPQARHSCCFTFSPEEGIVSQPDATTLVSLTVFASSFSLLHGTSQNCCLEIFSVGLTLWESSFFSSPDASASVWLWWLERWHSYDYWFWNQKDLCGLFPWQCCKNNIFLIFCLFIYSFILFHYILNILKNSYKGDWPYLISGKRLTSLGSSAIKQWHWDLTYWCQFLDKHILNIS